MRVDIVGRGIIPGLGSNAPVYDKDMSELEIERVLKFASLKVYLAGTSVAVIRRNLHELIMLDNSPKKTSTNASVKKTAKTVTPVEATTYVQKTAEATVETTEETTIPDEMPEEEITTAETTVEEVEETTPVQQQSKSSKKKNRR